MMIQPPAAPGSTDRNSDAESLSQAVVTTVANAEGVDETDLEAIFTVCDPDALDSLFGGQGDRGISGHVQFQYHGYDVRVHADGEIQLLDQ